MLEIAAHLLFWANALMSWAMTSAGCCGCAFMMLDMYQRRDEIANRVLMNRANDILNEAKRNHKKRLTIAK